LAAYGDLVRALLVLLSLVENCLLDLRKHSARCGMTFLYFQPGASTRVALITIELENVMECLCVWLAEMESGLGLARRDRDQPQPHRLDRIAASRRGKQSGGSREGILVQALEEQLGNQTRAARYLNISRKTLMYRMEKFGLVERGAIEPEPASDTV
jgi:hypothetical protein